MSTVSSNVSPRELLGCVRGPVTDVCLTYPERMRLEVTDAEGGLWCLSTWYAEYSPADPEELGDKVVSRIDLDDRSGLLTLGFSDGSCFTVTPIPDEEDDAIENWQLFTPDNRVLSYGPGDLWSLDKADEPVRPRRPITCP